MKYKLSDCINIVSGGTPKKSNNNYWNGDIPWITIKDFCGKYPNTFSQRITLDGLKNSPAKLTKEKDVLISARGTVGEIMMVHSGYTFNQSIYGLRVKENIMLPDYLYYWLLNNKKAFLENVHGSVFDTITRKTFDHISIDVPSLIYQKKVVVRLNKIDEKVKINNRINDNMRGASYLN